MYPGDHTFWQRFASVNLSICKVSLGRYWVEIGKKCTYYLLVSVCLSPKWDFLNRDSLCCAPATRTEVVILCLAQRFCLVEELILHVLQWNRALSVQRSKMRALAPGYCWNFAEEDSRWEDQRLLAKHVFLLLLEFKKYEKKKRNSLGYVIRQCDQSIFYFLL